MSTPEAITDVREKTNEFTDDPWADQEISDMIDEAGSNDAAAAIIWRKKAAKYADLVNVSEAGASQALSDLYDRALKQALHFESESGVDPVIPSMGPAQVHVIRRTS